ncbi:MULTISPECIES: diacylglycerol kinase family protein [Methylobacterium]|uniref:diacylglycerol/lipid kinase family protein n=1 Tax=Methylobacterium TaxID=407 RepID=UPI0008EA8023|nr:MULTISPECIES: diacylglycerol kinase family protein [Methylobacterium]MBZ6413539.1 diacylglycerol kinase [Methylobacterium sp.]MBK3399796.1 diacylglycerol kinase [Methylobacterium ajmalii]MBK3408954.1 diacylglycerol kinase [Methylobacterium ajmalii]MBK3426486.1 diacylglycerol kinase [Methylobacterium ajmalii]SFE53016.1 Diacylglycerol kinase family enzyme [Methylobacterium sp. yr596]
MTNQNTPSPARRIVLVANVAAGSLVDGGLTPEVLGKRLEAAGLDVVAEPRPDAPLPERLEAAATMPDIDAVAVAGGDGTLACAAQALTGKQAPLGILPLGTMNLLAKDLGLPLDLDAAVQVLATGTVRAIDAGEVNGHVFLINSVLGLPARMARHREAKRGRMGVLDVVRMGAGLLRHLGRYPRDRAVLTLAGESRRVRFRTLAVVCGDYREGLGQVLSRAGVDGGHLTLYLVETLSAARLVRLGLGFAVGEWRRLPDLERHETDALMLDARKALRVMNDGEVVLIAPPLHYRLRASALRVLVPAEDPR